MNQEIVTIDLGSNSFRVLKYDCKNHKIISEYNEVVGMADGLVDTGLISKEAIQRVIVAILHSIEVIKYNPQDAICVTTAAMRNASNSEEILKYLSQEVKTNFSIIDGKEEARLTLLAVKYALKREKINSDKFVLLDIGGGSTEIIINTNNSYKAHSFDFGIVTLTQRFLNHDDLKNDLENKKLEIKLFLNSLNIDFKDYSFVATAGTPTTIAAIKLGQDFFSYDRNIVNGTIVNLEDMINCLNIFKNSSKEDIVKLVGRGRVDFIEVGIYIYKMIFEVLEKDESIVLDDGLREGVAINYCETKCKN
ncbi:Ppx/GppA phosphatase family protein [Arcobacter caeni]|uniref:Exopolyphosphatase n=1 Tax=Arcobacter caeni TaxID=1912877 RepID=A0A363CXM7_9BACT|nr:exopolyphosphatase [Arcobacter caeni]PUE63860.1 exopolyphosphatase [Arcobacter caeni]